MNLKTLAAVAAVAALGWTSGGLSQGATISSTPIRSVGLAGSDTTSADLDRARTQLDRATSDLKDAQAEEATAQQAAEQASQAAADAAVAAKRATAVADSARNEHAVARTVSEETGAELSRLAAYAYANNGHLSELAQLGTALDPTEFQSRTSNLSELLRLQDTLLQQAAVARADAANAADRTEAQAEAAVVAADKAKELAGAAKTKLAAAAAATSRAEEALGEVKRVHAAAQRAAAERARASQSPARGSREVAPSTPVPSGNAVFIRPSTGHITSPYGMRVHPLTGVYKLHSGTDFAAPCGAPAQAAYAGTVEETGYAGAYGNQVVIAHGQIAGVSVTTTYNHLSSISVSPGQGVAAGDVVGRVGTTGSSTGCHLHFEVLTNGSFTNPVAWF